MPYIRMTLQSLFTLFDSYHKAIPLLRLRTLIYPPVVDLTCSVLAVAVVQNVGKPASHQVSSTFFSWLSFLGVGNHEENILFGWSAK